MVNSKLLSEYLFNFLINYVILLQTQRYTLLCYKQNSYIRKFYSCKMKLTFSKRQWRNYYQINKILLFLITLIILLFLFPKEGKFKYEFQRGKPWQNDDLIAPFDFAVLKTDAELQRERRTALAEAYLFFRFDSVTAQDAKTDFVVKFDKTFAEKYKGLTYDKKLRDNYLNTGIAILDSIYKKGIIETVPQIEHQGADFKIAVLKENFADIVSLKDLYTVGTANEYILRLLGVKTDLDPKFLLPVIQSAISLNVIYDEAMTAMQRDQLLNNVSATRGMVQKEERIVAKGDLINEVKFQQLKSLKHEFESKSGHAYNYKLITLGRIILIAMALMVFALFMYTFRHDIYAENRNIVLLLILVTIMVSFTTVVMNINAAYIMAVPICLVPIIVRTFYDTRLALFVHIITIILLGFLVPNSFEFLFMQLITGIITIISVVHLRRRSQFFFTSMMILFSYSIIYLGMTLMQDGNVEEIRIFNFVLFGISALLTLFSYPLIYLFERLFGMVTDVSLIELSDTNSRLLRDLAIKAPGTFQHSLIVANIAEEAAHAIHANPLLARTGALYHDIGKMDMPLYYIENQAIGINPHDELSSEESAKIITGHVIRGIEKARLYKLPEAIIDFIRTHHGTRYTQYFYQKHMQENMQVSNDDSAFRYHGPTPFTKETSILMMADSIEAATRAMQNKDEQHVDELVERLIDNQMDAKQFKNSLLTLKDITTIKKIIKNKLLSIYHIRIEYPVSNESYTGNSE